VDSGEGVREYPDTKLVRLAGKSIYVLHDLKMLQADPGAGVIIFGHSHVPKNRHRRWRSLPEFRQRGTATFQAAYHARDACRRA